nr:MAG TPA: hypothetical protein [Caudoviricetes sp.]
MIRNFILIFFHKDKRNERENPTQLNWFKNQSHIICH